MFHTDNRNQLNTWVKEYSNVGDLILFKAGHPSHLAKTIDQVFGTSFHITDADVIQETGKNITSNHFNVQIVDGVCNIKRCTAKNISKVVVPKSINSTPVFKIGTEAFSRNNDIKEVIIEKGIQNIGFAAFYVCKNLKEVTIPSTCKVIERSAFNHCISLKEVKLPEGITTLERRAFYDCRSLKKIVIPDSVKTIGDEVFKNCKKLTIHCTKGSYAEAYATKENIPVKIIKKGFRIW